MIVVLLPSATVLWLTDAAIGNERAAMRQRLVKTYQRQLALAARQIDQHWSAVDQQCAALASDAATAAELFADCVRSDLADAVLILSLDGGLDYPVLSDLGADSRSTRLNEHAWHVANQLEFVERDLDAAIDTYAAIASVEPDPRAESEAWIAHARCLEKNGQFEAAISVLTHKLRPADRRDVIDAGRRSPWLDGQLRALELLQKSDPAADAVDRKCSLIRAALEDYGQPLPSAQRQFVMREVLTLCPDQPRFVTLHAEQLAMQYAERVSDPRLAASAMWNLRSDPDCVLLANARVVLLFRGEVLADRMHGLLKQWQTDDARIHLIATDTVASASEVIATVPLQSMSAHHLALSWNNPNLFDETSRRQASLYMLAGLITIAIVGVVAVIIAVFVRRQLRLAQLKNDLAAIVTHELRTPLASIRMLVDTLLEGNAQDERQNIEYLRLISQENERLSRLIENFLTFSKSSREQETFVFETARPGDLVDRAVAAIGARLKQSDLQFSVDVANDLPLIRVDADAVVMVLLNLLDNAVKFSGQAKSIRLRAGVDHGSVVFQVADEGIGMSPADSRRIFDPFYQADTRLSRGHGGCGLGLSLVRSIVLAHQGTVTVESAPGSGSTFTVRLPALETAAPVREGVTT